MPRPIALLTDFGLADPYVGQMKGVLLRLAPNAAIVDICHQVRPCHVAQAGFFLAASQAYFPDNTIFVAVVDPGVGSARRILLAECGMRCFLAPDNGLLTQVVLGAEDPVIWDITPPAIATVGATFHGRDIFAPLAARLANGEPASALGIRVDIEGMMRFSAVPPAFNGGRLTAEVLHVDHFGNCVLNLDISTWAKRLEGRQALEVHRCPDATGCAISAVPQNSGGAGAWCLSLRVVRTYEQLAPGELGLLAGSQGFMELALNQASAAAALGVTQGDSVAIQVQANCGPTQGATARP